MMGLILGYAYLNQEQNTIPLVEDYPNDDLILSPTLQVLSNYQFYKVGPRGICIPSKSVVLNGTGAEFGFDWPIIASGDVNALNFMSPENEDLICIKNSKNMTHVVGMIDATWYNEMYVGGSCSYIDCILDPGQYPSLFGENLTRMYCHCVHQRGNNQSIQLLCIRSCQNQYGNQSIHRCVNACTEVYSPHLDDSVDFWRQQDGN